MAATDVIYAKAFFDLQFDCAEIVSRRSGLDLPSALFEYTNFYIRFGQGRSFDPTRAAWQEYLAGLRGADDGREWTYRFYRSRPHDPGAPAVVATSGCFSYARLDDDRIRLHFLNAETDGHSPLAKDRRDQRVAELTALFNHVKDTVQHPVRVIGGSWLYNLEAYRRLFPPRYIASARAVPPRFRHMPLWGQFVDRHGEVKEMAARQFRDRLGRLSDVEGLGRCFPFPVIAVEASVLDFYECYGL